MAISAHRTATEADYKHWSRNDLSRHLSFALILLAVTLGLVYGNGLQRVDLLIYDTHQQYMERPAPNDIVIIGVDEYSLSQLGRWPWPRRIHAQLIDKLTRAGSKAIMLDIIFTEPDPYDTAGDHLLAQAIRRNGGVILPVLFEQRYIGGQMIETLPLPEFIANAHGLGHAHVELDADGITRSVYLKEGLGDAYWSHLSVSLLELAGTIPSILPGQANPDNTSPTFNTLQRGNHVLTPYAGPPGHFTHVSFAKLLEENEASAALLATLENKIIFIGATASGLGDLLPTPVSALNHPMSGVEINANIFDALRQGLIIEPFTLKTHLLISALIALLPVLLFPRLSPRAALFMSLLLISSTLALTSLLLARFQLWFPPAPALLALTFAYPLWSWRRLEYANQFLSQELKRLNEEPALLANQSRDTESTMAFIKHVIPIKAWSLYQGSSHRIAHWGKPLTPPAGPPPEHSNETWHRIQPGTNDYWLGIAMSLPRRPTEEESRLMLDVIRPYLDESRTTPSSAPIELFEERVMQVQQAENRIRAMRRFLDNSLNQMSNGILVINNLGQLVFINAKALSYLDIEDNPQTLRDEPVMPLLDAIGIDGIDQWPQLLARTLVTASTTQAHGHTPKGLDLLIQINPLALEQHHINGVIINLSDISLIRANERQRLETFSFLSHDLRAPLASLLALVEVNKNNRTNSTDNELLKRVEMYTRRTLTLADDFLQISQLEQQTQLNFEIVDLGMIAANAIDAVWDDSSQKKIKITDNIPPDPIYIKGDPGLLERALINLLNNAIKYSQEGSSVELILRVGNKGEYVHCCIKDSGFGIAEEALGKIFDRYFRVDNPGHSNIPGSGLGLSFVKSVIDKHNGSIKVKSETGKGSQFCIQLAHIRDVTSVL